MIYINCNVSTLEHIKDLIDKFGADNYQIFEQVLSKNAHDVPRLNNAVYPGYNSVLMLKLTDELKYNQIISELRQYNKSVFNKSELISVCSWSVDDFFDD